MMQNRIHVLFILMIISANGIFYFLTIREGHDWGGDFSQYVHHAKNIAEGIGYEDTGYIYNPFYPSLGPKTYPPIFPLLLAPVYKWYGLNLEVMKIEIIIIFLLFLIVYSVIFKNVLPYNYLVLTIVLIGFNPYFWDFKDNVLSDIPFLMWTYISLFLILKANQSNQLKRNRLVYSIFVGFFIYLSYGTRSIGIVLILCLFLHDLIRYKRLTRSTVIATMILIIFLVLQSVFLHFDRSYFDQFTFDPEVILDNLFLYPRSLMILWDNGYNDTFKHLLFFIVSALATIGYVARIKDRVTILEVFLLVYVGAIIIWPGYPRVRFLIPVIPLYIVYAIIGIIKLEFIQYKVARKLFIAILIIAFLAAYFGKYSKSNYGAISEGIRDPEAIELFEYIRKNSDRGDVFIFRKPRVLSLFAERSASVYHQPSKDEDLWDYFHSINANYLIEGSLDSEYLHLFVERYDDRLEEVYSNSDFKIYKIENGTD